MNDAPISALYPQLPPMTASDLDQELRGLTPEELASRATTEHPDAVFTAIGGTVVETPHLDRVRDGIRSLADEFGWPGALAARDRMPFDRRCARLMWEEVRMLPSEAAVRDVWAFFALVLLPDVAYWRYPAPPPDRVQGTDLTRHVFARLWWRADALLDPDSSDPWHLIDTLREDDFVHIFEVRSIGGSRRLARAFAERIAAAPVSRDVVRDAQKRLLRLNSITVFDALEDDWLSHQVGRVVEEAEETVGQLES